MSKRFINLYMVILLFSEIICILPVRSNETALNPDYSWNLQTVGVEEAWKYTQGSPYITVAIIDSGIDFNHPDLMNVSWINPDEIPNNGMDDDKNGYIDDIKGWDFRDNDNDPSPGHEHGTKIAGIIAASDDDTLIVGISPKVKLMALRFLNNNNEFSGSDWDLFIDAIDYAIEKSVNIIHMSIQAYGTPPLSFYNAIKRANENEIIIVGVTGNNQDHVTYPGNYSEVIAVSAVDKNLAIADFSSPGEQNEICAPGKDIYTINLNYSELSVDSGTSFAAPLISGTIALMLSLNNSLSIDNIRTILHETSIDLGILGKDPIYGYGLLNTSAAVEKVVFDYNNGSSLPLTTSRKTSIPNESSFLNVNLTILTLITWIIYKRKKLTCKFRKNCI